MQKPEVIHPSKSKHWIQPIRPDLILKKAIMFGVSPLRRGKAHLTGGLCPPEQPEFLLICHEKMHHMI